MRLTLSQVFQRVESDATGKRLVDSPSYVTQAHIDVLTNLNLRAPELADGVELALGVFNLFDVEYSDPVGAEIAQDTLRQDGMTFALRLTVRR